MSIADVCQCRWYAARTHGRQSQSPTFSVRDLERSFELYRQVLGFRALARWARGAHLLAGESTWLCLTLDTRARTEPLAEYTHAAFSVTAEQFDAACERVKAAGVREACRQKPYEGVQFFAEDEI